MHACQANEVHEGTAECAMCKGGDLNTNFPFRHVGTKKKLQSAEALKLKKLKITIEADFMNTKYSRKI